LIYSAASTVEALVVTASLEDLRPAATLKLIFLRSPSVAKRNIDDFFLKVSEDLKQGKREAHH
jgi:hypothetical protein